MKRLDLINKTFGDIRIIQFLRIGKHGHTVWLAKCKCGETFEIVGSTQRLKSQDICLKCREERKYPKISEEELKEREISKIKEYNTSISLEGEVWESVKGFASRYVISNKGRIASILTNGKYKILKHKITQWGYHSIGLYDGNREYKKKFYMIHRLVALAFIKNLNNYPQVNHIDGNKNNNCVENLEWCTASQNILHSFRIGLKNMDRCFKPIIQYDKDHNFIKRWPSIKAATLNGYEISGIHKALNKTSKHYKGYIWEYESPNPRVKIKS